MVGRALAALGAVALLAACAAERPALRTDAQAILEPWLSLPGARLAQAADAAGTPRVAGAALPFRHFGHVASAAASGNDLYVADAAGAAVYRVDLGLRLMIRVGDVPARTGTRVLVGGDLSLYILDAQNRRVLRLSREGRLIATYAAPLELARPVDVALEEPAGVVLVADGVNNQIVAFHPLGGGARAITLRGDGKRRVASIAGLAAGADALYLSDPACGCIARVSRDGALLDTFGHGALAQPGPIAVDRHGRVFVADALDRTLKLFVQGRLARTWPAPVLGLERIEDLRIAEDRMALAGGASARAVLLRILEPAP